VGGFCCQHSHRDKYHIRALLEFLGVRNAEARHKPLIRVVAGDLHRVVDAAEKGDCQFVFIQYQSGSHVTELFKGRLERAFTALGMQAQDYCIFLPRLGPHQFLAAVGQSDVVLDSIGWTGCNSTLESLVFDLPIVTLMGSLMRGRHTAAILTMMSVAETIAQTVDDYVSIAIRLALDAEWRVAVRRRINENKYRIYRDRSSVAALGEFLNHVARKGGHGGG
jgi:protein O-GlcNAc transferase